MISSTQKKKTRQSRRHARIRAKVFGTAMRPRLSVFRSKQAIYAQLIDDEKGMTLASADSRKSKGKTPRERAKEAGLAIAKAGAAKKVKEVVFDRGGFEYKGKIQAIAEGAREGGLTF